MLPSLFVSHGAPSTLLDDVPVHRFLASCAADWPWPEAVLVVSAHWEQPATSVTGAARPATIHDFGHFGPELARYRYPAPGAPELAAEVAATLTLAGIPAEVDRTRGLDHGAWVPMALLYPDADVPVLQISINPRGGPAWHLALGSALRPFRDRALILASGNLTHNLYEITWRDPEGPILDWAGVFADWMSTALAEAREEDLLNYRRLAPFAVRNHPTEEHLLPLFTAMGAAGRGATGKRIHASHTYGTLAMDAYRFD
jgi:4,5-DOPA dioxygenase extradiol